MSDVHRLALHIFIVSVITRIAYLTLRMSAWRRYIAASALTVTFAKTIARCLSTNALGCCCLGIASDIESTSLLCWPSGAGARHRRRMSSQVCSLGLDEASACCTFIPFELPIHPTAMVHGVSSNSSLSRSCGLYIGQWISVLSMPSMAFVEMFMLTKDR